MTKVMLVVAAVLMAVIGCAGGGMAQTGQTMQPPQGPTVVQFVPRPAVRIAGEGMTCAASAGATADSAPTALYLPLKVNNIWRYRETVPGQAPLYYKARVIGTSVRGGSVWYPICWGEGGDGATTMYYQHNAQGLTEATQREADARSGDPAIRVPLTFLNRWSRGSNSWIIADTKGQTTVTAGTFTGCLVVMKYNQYLYTYRWYAPRKGIVRQETYASNGRLLGRVTLESCTLVP